MLFRSGVIPGGGVSLVRAKAQAAEVKVTKDEVFGRDLVLAALDTPLKTIADNAGKEGAMVLRAVEKEKGAYGYDAAKDVFGDLYEFGIIDPTKVTRSALENAASVAALLLTTDCIVADVPKEKGDEDAVAPDMGGMY